MFFTRSHNQAFAVAKGKYFLILNSDMIITNNLFLELKKYLEKYPDAGAVCPKFLGGDNLPQISCWKYWTFLSIIQKNVQFFHHFFNVRYKIYKTDEDFAFVDVISGGCMLMESEVFKSIGGFTGHFR